MNKTIDVVVVGDINIDLILIVEKLPERGGMQYVEKIIKCHGGVGGNIATTLSKLGLKTLLLGAVGDDVPGLEAVEELRKNRVDVSRIRIVEYTPTGLMIIIVDKDGERTMIGNRGANSELKIEEEDFQILRETSHLHVSGYLFLNRDSGEGVLRLLSHARRINVTTSIDIEGVAEYNPMLLEKLRGLFDYVMVGEREAKRFTLQDKEDKLVDELFNKLEARVVAVKLGGRGCIVASLEESLHIPPLQVKALDTTGAGDAFNAGFLYGLIRNLSIEEAGILGNAVGGYKCLGIGARHLPTLQDIKDTFPEIKRISLLD